jgi:monofunctional biosynthetic peptidoglycan transglycosylase
VSAVALAAVPLLTIALVLPWRWIAPPTTSFMLRAEPAPAHRWVDWDEISANAAIAVVASEDQKFPHHGGFDYDQIIDALEESGRPRGASTISQQVAKNLYLWPGRSLLRKGLEAYLTLFIEGLWPKRRILETYLNVAEFGPGVFGIGEASRRFFGIPAASLTPREAALLAAVLPNPRQMSAVSPSDYVRQRAAEIDAAVQGLGGAAYLAGL